MDGIGLSRWFLDYVGTNVPDRMDWMLFGLRLFRFCIGMDASRYSRLHCRISLAANFVRYLRCCHKAMALSSKVRIGEDS